VDLLFKKHCLVGFVFVGQFDQVCIVFVISLHALSCIDFIIIKFHDKLNKKVLWFNDGSKIEIVFCLDCFVQIVRI